MKTRFFLILSLFICSAWNLSLEGMSDKRKNEIINSIDNDTISSVLKDNEINADLGEIKFKDTLKRLIILKNTTTPLAYAISNNINQNEASIKFLLNKNAKLLQKYFISNSSHVDKSFKESCPLDVLINSLDKYHSEIVDWFILNKKPISEYRDKDNNTLLHLLASDDYYLQSFKKLYEKNLNVENLEATNNNGQTPLHIAIVLNGQQMPGKQIAKYIIEQEGVDLTKLYETQENNFKKKDIIFNRVWINSFKLPDLKQSACKKILESKSHDEPLSTEGDRLIHYAAQSDTWLNLMNNFLKKAPLEIIQRTNKNGKTALHVALDRASDDLKHKQPISNKEIITALIQSNKFDFTKVYETQDAYVSKANDNLFGYLTSTLNTGELKELAIQSIINTKKMNALITGDNGATLFHYLAQNSHLFKKFFSQVEVDFKVNINIKDKYNQTPLFYAQDITTLEKLIDCKADLNATTNNGDTILHHATKHKDNSFEPSPELLQYLLENTTIKNLINKKNKENKTAFDLVVKNIGLRPNQCAPYNDHIDLLLQYGAEVGDAIETLNKITKKPPILESMIRIIEKKNAEYTSKSGGSKPAPTTNPLSKQLSKLNKKLTILKEKLKALAENLGTLKSKLGVKK